MDKGNLSFVPKDMLVEVTNRCNHICVFCAHNKIVNRGGDDIDESFLKRVLHEAYDFGLRRVGLYSTGEMFMCKDIEKHIYNAHKIGFEYIYSDTNGALATERNLARVISAGLHSIKFSINAGNKETYKQIHGHDDFDSVIKNLKTCHMLKRKLNPELKIMVSFVVTKQNENEVELLRRIVASYVDVFVVNPVFPLFLQHNEDISWMTSEKYAENEYETTATCVMVMNRIHVTHNGFLSACCSDFNHDLLLADLKKVSLKEGWYSENAVNFRKRHLAGSVEGTMCHGCLQRKFIPYRPLLL